MLGLTMDTPLLSTDILRYDVIAHVKRKSFRVTSIVASIAIPIRQQRIAVCGYRRRSNPGCRLATA